MSCLSSGNTVRGNHVHHFRFRFQDTCSDVGDCQFYLYRDDIGECIIYGDNFSGVSDCAGSAGPNTPNLSECQPEQVLN